MDKLFLSGLLRRNANKKDARHSDEAQDLQNPGRAALGLSSQPMPTIPITPGALYSTSSFSSSASSSSATTAAAAAAAAAATAAAPVIGPPYGGRLPEQLLLDAASCDLVLLVGDELQYARALPAHAYVLRCRNAGGYFARVLGDPGVFAEYSERAAGPGSNVAVGELAGKPMIRRLHWPWRLATCLLSFLYRGSCEAGWEQLPELRRLAEEVGARGLCEAVDSLLDPQHLLPWTAADMRAVGAALRRPQLVEAAERYEAAMRATGLSVHSRMAAFVYHPRQVRPKLSVSISAPSSLPYIDGASPPPELSPTPAVAPSAVVAAAAGALTRFPSTRYVAKPTGSALSHTSSFVCRTGALSCASPLVSTGGGAVSGNGGSFVGGGAAATGSGGSFTEGSGGGGGVCTAGSSSSRGCFRDSRLGTSIIDGVLRSVSVDSKVLRSLLLPGRRMETILLCASGGGGSSFGPMGPSGAGRPRQPIAASPHSALAASRSGGGAAAATAAPTAPVRCSASELLPQISLARLRSFRSSNASGSGGSGVGCVVQACGGSFTGGGGATPALGCRSPRGTATGFGSGGVIAGGGGGGGGGGLWPDDSHPPEPLPPSTISPQATLFAPGSGSSSSSYAEPLLVVVPAQHLAPSLALLVRRPLDAHGPVGPPVLVPGPGGCAPGAGGLGGVQTGTGPSPLPLPAAPHAMLHHLDSDWRAAAAAPVVGCSTSSFAGRRGSFDPFGKLAGVPGLSWGSGGGGGGGGGDSTAARASASGVCGSVGSTAPCASLLQQLPPACSLGHHDQVTLVLALDLAATGGLAPTSDGDADGAGGSVMGNHFAVPPTAASSPTAAAAAAAGITAGRLMSSVLTALGASDHPQFVVRADAVLAAQAAAFERRRAAADMSSLHSLAGALGTGGTGSGSGTGGSFTTASACSTAVGAVKTVLGPANPRDYFIPLPDHPTGAITIMLPVGLVLVDPATLEAAAVGPGGPGVEDGLGQRSYNDVGNSSSALYGVGGVAGGGVGGVCTSARVAALMPHLTASAAALSLAVNAASMVSQLLRVVSQQQGLFAAPLLRACLRVVNPSHALIDVLAQTNTNFAVAPSDDNALYVRKPPADILRLLSVLQSTLPARGSNGPMNGHAGAYGCSANVSGGGGHGGCDGMPALHRARLGAGGDSSFMSGGLSRQASRPRAMRSSLDIVRTGSSTGYGSGSTAAAAPPPPALGRSQSRRSTFSELNLRAASFGSGSHTRDAAPAPPSSISCSSASYFSHGVPYSQLDRLFPGLQLQVVELPSPSGAVAVVEEF